MGPTLELAAEVVGLMSEHAGQATLVAIDDLHLIDSSPHVVSALELIARGLPPGWTLLLSSRRRVPLRIDEVTLGGRLVELKGRELRLTPHEVAAWALQNWAVQLQPSEARALWRVTEGWPVALVLLGQHGFSRGADVTPKDIAGAIARGRDLRAYLRRHILSGLDPLAAQTMLAAALLPRVIFPRDETYLPGLPGQAEAILEEFVSRGFLVTRAGRRSYTLHPLVRGFAEREAWRSDEETGLIGRAAEHLERFGEHHRAASLYVRAGRLEDAARPLRALTLSSLNAAANSAGDDWLDLIPEGADSFAGPWLPVAKARALQRQAKYADAGALYERAARLLSAAGDKEGLLPVLLGSAFCLFNQGLWDESLAVMKRCRSLAGSPEEKVEVLMAEGNVLVSLCRWDEAVENWERALVMAPAAGRASLTQRIHFHRARLFYSLGHYRLAKQWVEKALDPGFGPLTPAHAMALNGAAILAYLTGDYERAGRYTDECLRLVRTRGYALFEAASLLNQAAVALGRWEYRGAVAKIREAQALAAKAGDAEESFWAEDMLGDLCRRNQNPQRALEHHKAALDIVDKNRLAVFERVRALAAIGMDLVVLGREAEARASLEETVRVSRRWSLVSSLVPALFYLGWLHALSGARARSRSFPGGSYAVGGGARACPFLQPGSLGGRPDPGSLRSIRGRSLRAGEDHPCCSRAAPGLFPQVDDRQDLSHRRPARTPAAAGPGCAGARARPHGATHPRDAGRDRDPHRSRARGPQDDRPGYVQQEYRDQALHLREDGKDACQSHLPQVGRHQPYAGHVGLPELPTGPPDGAPPPTPRPRR